MQIIIMFFIFVVLVCVFFYLTHLFFAFFPDRDKRPLKKKEKKGNLGDGKTSTSLYRHTHRTCILPRTEIFLSKFFSFLTPDEYRAKGPQASNNRFVYIFFSPVVYTACRHTLAGIHLNIE